MGEFVSQILAFNRGLISKLALARIDLKRMALAAEVMVNWMPRVLGSMMLRPGWQWLGSTLADNPVVHIDFIFGTDDTGLIEVTNGSVRVRVDDAIVTRPAVTSTFAGGVDTASTFVDAGDVAKWTDSDEAGGVSAFATGGYLSLIGNGTASAIRDRQVNVAGANIGVEHALAIVVFRGNAVLRLGSTLGDDDYLEDRTLRPGYHSVALTPAGSFWIRLSGSDESATLVDSVTINQAAGDMVLPAPWMTANLGDLRWSQSGDVVFTACYGIAQKRIERQDRTASPPSRSWSVVDYLANDGPFGTLNVGPIMLKCSVISGDGTLTASKSFFKATHVGALFRLASSGQQVVKQITAENVFTDPIKVTGVGVDRNFTVELTGPTFSGTTTVTLQRSLATPGTWEDITSYTAVQTFTYPDGLDNQIIYYRIGVKTGDFTVADDLTAQMTYTLGSINGIARVTAYTSATAVDCAVIKDMGAADTFTQDWYEGDWSPRKGYPSAIVRFDGRLWFAGKTFAWGSESDSFDGFDETKEGAATTIKRTLGDGPVDKAHWLMALNNLIVGTPGAAQVAKANSIDDPLTPTAFSLKPVTTFGSYAVKPGVIDTNGIYVGRDGRKVFQLSADANLYTLVPYVPTELTAIVPEIGKPNFVRMAIQRSLDTRVHLVRSDGVAAIIVFDKNENVTCWLTVQTDGSIEDVAVLPGAPDNPEEDRVYYTVNRTIGGVTRRYLEKWAFESTAVGGTDNRIADSFVIYDGVPTVTIPVPHLIGKQVVVWADGVCPAATPDSDPTLFTVDGSGNITLATAASYVVAGLPYEARWKSATLAQGSQAGAPLAMMKTIDAVGLVLVDTHARGLKYGQDFGENVNHPMTPLPRKEFGSVVDPDFVWGEYTMPKMEVDGTWDADARVCLRAVAPRPVTCKGLVFQGTGHDNI